MKIGKSSHLTGKSARGKEGITDTHLAAPDTEAEQHTSRQCYFQVPRAVWNTHQNRTFWAGLNPAHFPEGMCCIFLFITERGMFSHLPELLQPPRQDEAPFNRTET